jgi:hypothetical protein
MAQICATTVDVTDNCDPNPEWVLQSITSDEPDNGTGDGNFPNDIQDADYETDDLCFDLRSERQGGEDGRKYTIIYRAFDDSGNSSTDTVCVRVPHDQGAGAMSSSGFIADGSGFIPATDRFALIIPSIDGMDAASIDQSQIYLGNTAGVARPEEIRVVQYDADRRPDLAVFFSAQRAMDLLGVNIVASDELKSNAMGRDNKPEALGMHLMTPTGADYLVSDILALGAPVEMPEDGSIKEPPLPYALPEVAEARETRLKSIHPNPFNPQTTVAISLASPGLVQIAIYDVRGALVRRLVDQTMSAGDHAISWNGVDDRGRAATSGIYFVRMIAGRYSETKKIVMLK